MSTSVAPSATARAASKALTSGGVAPSGKPATVQTRGLAAARAARRRAGPRTGSRRRWRSRARGPRRRASRSGRAWRRASAACGRCGERSARVARGGRPSRPKRSAPSASIRPRRSGQHEPGAAWQPQGGVGGASLRQHRADDGFDERWLVGHLAVALLDGRDLPDAPGVALLGALGGQERLDDLAQRVRVHEARAQGEHVGVVVLAGVLRGGGVDAERGPDARAPCWRPWPSRCRRRPPGCPSRASPARTARATASAMSG